MKRLTACLLIALLAIAVPTVGAPGCTEHYRVDPKTGKRYKISEEEYRAMKNDDGASQYTPTWRAPN